MKISITSIKKKVLELDDFESISISTKNWEITIMDSHEPLITALEPWILKLKHDSKIKMFAIWWWILETDGKILNIIADMVEDWAKLDINEIKMKKEQARLMMEKYKKENKIMDMDRFIELETEFLKESAKEQLVLL